MVEHPNLAFHREYTLLAQTPMIHFQPSQAGAALRPSEVKPKLDRYLRRMYGKEVPKAWLVSEQTQALNYQMRILACGEDKSNGLKIGEHCKAYFGNMGNAARKDLVFRNCRLEINCFIPGLLKLIDKHIGSFFVLHNFGTRQSKGFGGFLVKENGCSEPDFVKASVHNTDLPYFYFDLDPLTDIFQRINHAYAVYSVLKSGVNMSRNNPDRYIKGYSLRKFLPSEVGSDKAFVKGKVWPSSILRRNETKQIYPSYSFIRAMLGLAENYEFRDDARNGGSKTVIDKRTGNPKEVLNGEKVQILHLPSGKEEKLIQRFASPILIKITEERIFFILADSWKQMLGRTFVMAPKPEMDQILALSDKEAREKLEALPHICTPNKFDGKAFIGGFVDYFNSGSVKRALRSFPTRGDGPKPRAGFEFREAEVLELKKGWEV